VARWKRATRCESTSCVEIQWRRAGRCENATCVEVAWRRTARRESNQCVEVGAVDTMGSWRKTTRCETAACVEVNARAEASAVLMRDSKNPDGTVLEFTAQEWRDFCTFAREGRNGQTAMDVRRFQDGRVVISRDGRANRVLVFTVEEWDVFEAGVRGGEFDDLALG
jgi:hypothetical protein